jgi:hypothetical protein
LRTIMMIILSERLALSGIAGVASSRVWLTPRAYSIPTNGAAQNLLPVHPGACEHLR